MAVIAPRPKYQTFDSNGDLLIGGLLYTKESGTDTNKESFTDETEATPNTNPIILNSRGECDLWLTAGEAYRLRQEDALGNLIWQIDGIIGGGGSTAGVQVSSIADLKNTSPSGLSLAHVLGYYAAGDDGGAIWYWNSTSTTSDNRVTVIELNSGPTTGRWERVSSEIITFKEAGAVGDGVTDDTASISAAITWVDANSKILLATDGTYLISSSLTIGTSTSFKMEKGASFSAASACTVTINGTFEGAKTVNFGSNITAAFAIGAIEYALPEWWGAVGDNSTDCTAALNSALAAFAIVKLSIGEYLISATVAMNTGNTLFGENRHKSVLITADQSANLPQNYGILSGSGIDNITIRGVGFDNSANYPSDEATTVPNQNVVLNDTFAFATIYGIWLQEGGDNIVIEDCHFDEMSRNSIRLQKPSTNAKVWNRIRVINNTFFKGAYTGKVITIYGFDASDPANDVIVSNNNISGASVTQYNNPGINTQAAAGDGIDMQRIHNLVVANNTIRDVTLVGIRCERCENASIVGNTLDEIGAHGISVYNSGKDVTVTANTIRNWGKIPNIGSLRWYSGASYIAREFPISGTVNLPADPSSSDWWEANPYYSPIALANLPGGTIPTYNTGNYYDGGVLFTSLGDGGDPTNDSNFTSAHNQGILPFRGYAAIVVSQLTERVVIANNRIKGNLTQTSSLYNYASDFGISTVHGSNDAQAYDSPIIAMGNMIEGVIKEEIYQPSNVDPINQRGAIDGIYKYRDNYKLNSDDELEIVEYDDDPKIFDNIKYSKSIPKITLTKASSGVIKIAGSSRPAVGTDPFGMLLQIKLTATISSSPQTRVFDSGAGGASTAGWFISMTNNDIYFGLKNGSTNTQIQYVAPTLGTAPDDVITLYVTRDANGLRMTVIFDNDLTRRHIPEISGGAAAATYDMDTGGYVAIGNDSSLSTPYAPMELYRCIIWAESFTQNEILSRLDRKRLIKTDDDCIFDLNTSNYGQFFLDNTENSKIIYASATGIQSSEPGHGAFACWKSSTNGSEWITGADQKCLPDDFVITHIIAETTGTPDIQVGSSSGGDELVTTATLSAGKNSLTLVTPFSSTGKISVTSDDTSVISWSVLGYRARY